MTLFQDIHAHVHAKQIQSCLTLCDPTDCSPPGSCLWDSPGKNTAVGCHALLQGIFPTQGLNPHVLHLAALAGSLPVTAPGKSPSRTYMHFISESPRSFPKHGCHIPSLVELLILPLISTIQPQLRTDRMKTNLKLIHGNHECLDLQESIINEPSQTRRG